MPFPSETSPKCRSAPPDPSPAPHLSLLPPSRRLLATQRPCGLHAEARLHLCRGTARPRCHRGLGGGTGTPATPARLVSGESLFFFLVREAENDVAREEPSYPSPCVKWRFPVRTGRKEREQQDGAGLCQPVPRLRCPAPSGCGNSGWHSRASDYWCSFRTLL